MGTCYQYEGYRTLPGLLRCFFEELFYYQIGESMDAVEDKRNIVDEFKGLSVENIRDILQERRNPFASLILNIEYDINIASVVRNHNAFCGQEIFYIGRKKFNRRGCVGTYLYENITYFETLENALEKIPQDYTWVGIDNIPGAISMPEYKWPEKALLVFGHERGGLGYIPELASYCKDVVYIPQTGSVRSLNVACASAVAMYDFVSKGT